MGCNFTKPNEINILCFGASQTSGYYIGEYYINQRTKMPSRIYHSPYSITLQKQLRYYFKKNNINKYIPCVYSNGKDGQRALNMKDRLIKCLNERKYKLVILQCGGNDMAYSKDYRQISKSIIDLHKICHKKYISTMIITISDAKKSNIFINTLRNNINKQLSLFYLNCKQLNDKNDNSIDYQIFFWDFYKDIPYHKMDDELRKKYWNDGLHLTPKGYEYLAECIYKNIENCIQNNVE